VLLPTVMCPRTFRINVRSFVSPLKKIKIKIKSMHFDAPKTQTILIIKLLYFKFCECHNAKKK
jgi:hypothetical protein